MKLYTEIKQRTLIVRLEGEVDMHVADTFRKTVDEAMEQAGVPNLMLNLARVTFIDSSGLGVILGRYKRIAQLGGRCPQCNCSLRWKKYLNCPACYAS